GPEGPDRGLPALGGPDAGLRRDRRPLRGRDRRARRRRARGRGADAGDRRLARHPGRAAAGRGSRARVRDRGRMKTVAILPVKSFGRAKQRLTGGYPDRPSLAAAMVADVLDALAAVPLDVIVVSAQSFEGVDVVHDPVEAGQSAAALLGVRAAL